MSRRRSAVFWVAMVVGALVIALGTYLLTNSVVTTNDNSSAIQRLPAQIQRQFERQFDRYFESKLSEITTHFIEQPNVVYVLQPPPGSPAQPIPIPPPRQPTPGGSTIPAPGVSAPPEPSCGTDDTCRTNAYVMGFFEAVFGNQPNDCTTLPTPACQAFHYFFPNTTTTTGPK